METRWPGRRRILPAYVVAFVGTLATLAVAWMFRNWEVVSVPSPAFTFSRSGWGAWLVLLAGLVITALSVLLVQTLSSQAFAVRYLVHQRTADLKAANERLEREIREKERLEFQFRRLVEWSPDAMVIVDRGGRVLLINEEAQRLFGYSIDEIKGQSVELLIPARLRERHVLHRDGFHAAPTRRPMSSSPQLSCLRKDGTEFPAEISLSPIETAEGGIVSAVIRDLTERKRAEAELRNRDAQLLAAQRIQQQLLPRSPPKVVGFDIAGASYPAEFAAGDHFDFLTCPSGELGIVVGDVSGHGIGPALLMACSHALIHILNDSCDDLGELLTRANTFLSEQTEVERFITLFIARLDPRARQLSYLSAGHPPGYVWNSQGNLRALLSSTSVPLGVCPDTQYPRPATVQIEPGDLVLLYTDGVLEAAAANGELFGFERMRDVVLAHGHRPAAEIAEAIYRAVVAFSEGHRPADDVTAVVLKSLSED